MALPTVTQISTLEYSNGSSLYCVVPSKSTIDNTTLEYTNGSTLLWAPLLSTTGEISVADKVWTSIKKIGGVIISVIKKIGGVEP